MPTITFCSVGGEYGCFSNFAPYPITLKGQTRPTPEHYFQAQEFAGTKATPFCQGGAGALPYFPDSKRSFTMPMSVNEALLASR